MAIAARYVAARLIKFFGNGSKGISYGLHYFFPKKRFSIPHDSGPLWRRTPRHRVPKKIWQTNYTDRVTLAVYLNYLFNRLMSPTYAYRFMSSAERAEFVERYYPGEIFKAFSRLQIGAAQADFWRVLVLQQFGGVYLDIDAHVVWPLGYIVGPDQDELYLIDRAGRFTNCFIASAKENPKLAKVAEAIVQNIRNPVTNNVFHLTGPTVFDTMLRPLDPPTVWHAYTCYQGTFTNRYFQYIDHPQGKWTSQQARMPVVRPD